MWNGQIEADEVQEKESYLKITYLMSMNRSYICVILEY